MDMEQLLTEQIEAMYLQIKQLEHLLQRARPYTLDQRGDLHEQITKALARRLPQVQRRRA